MVDALANRLTEVGFRTFCKTLPETLVVTLAYRQIEKNVFSVGDTIAEVQVHSVAKTLGRLTCQQRLTLRHLGRHLSTCKEEALVCSLGNMLAEK